MSAQLGRFNWYPWARYQAIGAGFFILTGGVISLWYPNMIMGAVNIATGLLLMAWNYPVTPFDKLGPLSSNLWIRTLFHLVCIAPAIFQAPTVTGAMCLACCVLVTARAAMNGEKWEAPKPRGKGRGGGGGGKDMSAIKAPEN